MNGQDRNTLLETPRLHLEPLTAQHAPDLFRVLSDPQIYRFIPDGPPSDPEVLRARYARLESRSSPDGSEAWLNWAIVRQEVVIGRLEATVQLGANRASLAYLLSPTHWGQGFALEAVGALLAHLERQGVEEVRAWVDSRNAASMRLLERLGFARLEFIPAADQFKGAVSDEWVYGHTLERVARKRQTLQRSGRVGV